MSATSRIGMCCRSWPSRSNDLQLSDWQVGLLIGPAIAFFYAVIGIPMAWVADRVHRVRFLAICLALWSLLTALGGVAGNAWQLAH
jgi:MFS family permease